MRIISTSLAILFTLLLVSISSVGFAWPQYLEGRPYSLDPGGKYAYFIWHNDDGFHLRTTISLWRHHFSGMIKTDGKFRDIEDDRMEDRDSIRVSASKHTLEFNFFTSRDLDGIDFEVADANWVRFDLYMDGRPISSERIYLGRHGHNPPDNTFKILNRTYGDEYFGNYNPREYRRSDHRGDPADFERRHHGDGPDHFLD
ncbi:MAG: hypothetical protein AAGU23_03685 [Bacillota bacterium]|nr:hypothetical protein [Bacillota bacterium]